MKKTPMSKDTKYWYQRTIDQITLSGRSQNTAVTYAREIKLLGLWTKKKLDKINEEDLRNYMLYRRNDCELGASSMRILYNGLKALYQDVLGKKWPLLELIKSQKEERLPVVISREEVHAILKHAYKPQHQAYLRLIYSCGLRLSEGLNLTVNDINGKRKLIHIHGKGAKDRYVPIADKTYEYLRWYWAQHRHPLYIFPALNKHKKSGLATKPMSVSAVQSGLRRAVKQAGITRSGIHIHTLRHSYATHLLENGVSIKTVQEYLGHSSLQVTIIYLHLTNWGKEDAFNKINTMMEEI